MIKKLLTTGLVLSSLLTIKSQQMVKSSGMMEAVAIKRSGNNQNVQNKTTATLAATNESDSLFYFYNKHTYRNTAANANSFPTARIPQPPTFSLTEIGSSFLNPSGASATVTGGYVLAARQANSTSTSIPIQLNIYSAVGGVPGGLLASAITAPVTNTLGDFYAATFSAAVVVNGDFFMSYKPMPLNVHDTTVAFFTSAWTATSTSGTGWAPPLKFGEGLSFLKAAGGFGASANSFGTGTELEAIVVPFVAFSYSAASSIMAANGCSLGATDYEANVPISFTNSAGPASFIDNRQYNYNVFAPYWSPYVNLTPSITPVVNPVHNWSSTGTNPPAALTTSIAMPITRTWGAPTSTAAASENLISKYQHSTAAAMGSSNNQSSQALAPALNFTIVNCGITGIAVNSLNTNLSVYPNPIVNGKATVSGLEGVNTVSVYNMLGQMISSQTSDKEVLSIDLTNQVQGTYLVRITDSYSKSKTIKLINQ